LRIFHITDAYDQPGGIQTYLKSLMGIMRDRGHQVEIYSPPGVQDHPGSYLSRWLGFNHYRAVGMLLDEYRPAVLHAHSLSMRLSPLPLKAAVERSVPVVMTVHDVNYVCPKKWLIYRDGESCSAGFGGRCLVSGCPSRKESILYEPYHHLRWLKCAIHRPMLRSYVDAFVCPSEALSDLLKENLGVRRVYHIPNFVDERIFVGSGMRNYENLLFVGRLTREKGVHLLLRAMPLILESCPGAVLTIVGDGPDRKNLEESTWALGIAKKVRFAGAASNENLPDYYEETTICLLPSLLVESGPISGLEALACGRPLVGSGLGGVAEMVRKGRTGLLFKRGDHRDLAGKVISLLGNRELLQGMGEDSRAFYEEKFSGDRHLESLLSLYVDPQDMSAAG
jgi:glycosyltransferase involved in cell wall biosynthesis